MEIPTANLGYYGKPVYLVDINELKSKPQYFSENPEIFYRSNIGNTIEAFNVFGCHCVTQNGKPLTQKISMQTKGILDYITANEDNFLFGVSTKHNLASGIEAPLNFEKGLLSSHAYSLKIKQNPTTNKIEYVLTNPYNSIREIILSKAEMQKYIRCISVVKK